MLTNEDRSKLTEAELTVLYRDAAYAARSLGQSLKITHNEDPHPERNAPSPADGVRIRILRPQPKSYGWGDDVAVKRHNDFVSSLGVSGELYQ